MKKLYKYEKLNCAPCYSVQRLLDKINLSELGYELFHINVEKEENKEEVEKNKIDKVPVLMLENGEKLIGQQPKSIIVSFLRGEKYEVSN